MASVPYYDIGLHVGEITSQALTKAATGNMQFILGVKVLGTPFGDSYEPHSKQYIRTIYWTITEKTMPFIVEKLQALEFEGTKFSQLDPSSADHISLIRKQVDLWCKHEDTQDGGVKERWDISNGGAAKAVEPLTQRETRNLDAMFGKALTAGKPPAKAAAVQHTEDVGITDDDIPF